MDAIRLMFGQRRNKSEIEATRSGKRYKIDPKNFIEICYSPLLGFESKE